jgi:hypothetical protein
LLPLSISGLLARSFMKSIAGRLPSAWRGPMAPVSAVDRKLRKTGSAVLPRHVVAQDVPNPSLAAAGFEAIAVARRGLAGPAVAVAVVECPTVLDDHGTSCEMRS